MTAANLRPHFFSLSTKVSDNLKTNKRLSLSANFSCSFPKIYCSRRRSSGRISSPPVDLSIDKLEADGCSVNYNRWKSVAKRKVAMRVGYIGTDYKGLQIQRDSASTVTIEGELERAILKAGGILESNYGNLHKIGWRRSSRTDKGVHSLATVITLKMEVPDGAWVDDPDGTQLAEVINQYLPYNVRVFSILPINKGFDARIDCASRKYMYLLPAEAIGIENNCSPEEIEQNVREFRDILQIFKGNHPFHNYTIRAQYRKHSSKTLVKVSRPNFPVKEGSNQESNDCIRKHRNSTKDGNNLEKEISRLTDLSDAEEDHMNSIQDIECEPNMSSTPEVSKIPRAKWLHERDEADLISAAHFRKILSCTCGDLEAIANVRYIEISIHGESFVFHQIRKMVGTAVAVMRGLLPRDIIKFSLSRHSRIVLPLAPSEVLVLSGNEFYIPEKLRSWGIPSNSVPVRSEISRLTGSDSIQDRVDDFYTTVLLPELANYLDPLQPLWKRWLERLDMSAIPHEEMNEVRRAWIQWQENHVSRKQEVTTIIEVPRDIFHSLVEEGAMITFQKDTQASTCMEDDPGLIANNDNENLNQDLRDSQTNIEMRTLEPELLKTVLKLLGMLKSTMMDGSMLIT